MYNFKKCEHKKTLVQMVIHTSLTDNQHILQINTIRGEIDLSNFMYLSVKQTVYFFGPNSISFVNLN